MSEDIIITEDFVVRNTKPPSGIPECSVAEYYHQLMNQWAKENYIGLVNGETGEQWAFAKWISESKRFTLGLVNQGLTKSDLVLFYGDNTIQYAVAMFGVIFSGLTMSPVGPANGPFELTQQIKDSQGSVLIIDRDKLGVLKQAIENDKYKQTYLDHIKLIVVLNCAHDDTILADTINAMKDASFNAAVHTFDDLMNKTSGTDITKLNIPYYPTSPNDHFLIIYTSGTTGVPKGAIHTNSSMIHSCDLFREDFFQKGTHFTMWYPFGHISGSFFTLLMVRNGVGVILFYRNNLDKMLDFVSKNKLFLMIASPDNVTKLAQEDYNTKYDLSSLKYVWAGGTKFPPCQMEIIEKRYNVTFYEAYGSTEMMLPVRRVKGQKLGFVGRPVTSVEMKIIDLETGENLPPNQSGEICLRGKSRFVGYLRNEVATKKTIDSEGWYHTGDVGYYDDTGSLFVEDRAKEFIKFRIWSVSPAQVEHFIMRNDSVDSVCVVGVKHQVDGYHLRAFVKIKPGHKLTEQDIINDVKENMGFHKRLRGGVRFVDHMPRTSIHKVDRKYFHSLVKDELLTNQIE